MRQGGGPRYERGAREVSAEELLLPPRLERIEQVVARRTGSLTVVLDRLEDTFNMAAVLRTCEAMGLQAVHVIDNPEVPFAPNRKVTQGCHKWLDVERFPDAASCLAALQAQGFTVLASSAAPAATSLYSLRFDAPLALVFGNERTGVSEEVQRGASGRFWLPMRGFVQSLNVSAAVAASLSYAVGWRTQHLGDEGDLPPARRQALTTRFQQQSVKQAGRLYR